jgi:hypothetical protein
MKLTDCELDSTYLHYKMCLNIYMYAHLNLTWLDLNMNVTWIWMCSCTWLSTWTPLDYGLDLTINLDVIMYLNLNLAQLDCEWDLTWLDWQTWMQLDLNMNLNINVNMDMDLIMYILLDYELISTWWRSLKIMTTSGHWKWWLTSLWTCKCLMKVTKSCDN